MRENFKLSDIPKHNVYQVPENYFEQLPRRVMDHAVAAPAQTWQTASIWKPVRMVVAPLVLMLVFLGVFYLNMPVQPAAGSMALGSLQDQEIVHYLSTYATLESADFADLNSIGRQDLTADFLNISAKTAEEELEYYHIKNIDY